MNYLVSLNMPRLNAAKYGDINHKSANKPKAKKHTMKKIKCQKKFKNKDT